MASSWTKVLVFLTVVWSASGFAEWVRSNRSVIVGRHPHISTGIVDGNGKPTRPPGYYVELILYSKVDPNLGTLPSERHPTYFSQAQILNELYNWEEFRFRRLRETEFFGKGANYSQKLERAFRTEDPLVGFDEILALNIWVNRDEPNFFDNGEDWMFLMDRVPVGLFATKRHGLDAKDKLVAEVRHGLNIKLPTPKPFVSTEFVPLHWRPMYREIAHKGRVINDVVEFGPLATDQEAWPGVLPYVFFFAYWHGLFTTGRIIPEGESVVINGERIKGPVSFIPTQFITQSYGNREFLYKKFFGANALPIIGNVNTEDPTKLEDPADKAFTLSIQEFRLWYFVNQFANRMQDQIQETFPQLRPSLGRLQYWNQAVSPYLPGIPRDGMVPLDPMVAKEPSRIILPGQKWPGCPEMISIPGLPQQPQQLQLPGEHIVIVKEKAA